MLFGRCDVVCLCGSSSRSLRRAHRFFAPEVVGTGAQKDDVDLEREDVVEEAKRKAAVRYLNEVRCQRDRP
jgi:hypothetical protein